MWSDQRLIREIDLMIFLDADSRALLGQKSLVDNSSEQNLVRSIGKAKQTVQSLGWRAVLVRKGRITAELYSGPVELACTAYFQLTGECICTAQNQVPLPIVRELQEYIAGQLIGRILFLPQNGDIEQMKQCMGGFVQQHVQRLANERVLSGDARRSSSRIGISPKIVKQLIAHRNHCVLVSCIRLAIAILELQPQSAGPFNVKQKFSHALERLFAPENVAKRFKSRMGWSYVFDDNSFGLGGLRQGRGRKRENCNDEDGKSRAQTWNRFHVEEDHDFCDFEDALNDRGAL
jgi:hypothetical protein